MRLSSGKIAVTVALSIILVMAFAGGVLAAPPWSDAPNTWWVNTYGVTATEVATVADGFPDGTFKPANAVTRGQFAKMSVSGLDLPTADPAAPTFLDVAKGSTFYVYVEGAYDEGLIGGYPVTGGLQFRPNNNITRQQTNSILGRYLSQAEIDATGVIHGTVSTYNTLALWFTAEGAFYLNGFTDGGQVAAEHRATTAYLVFHEIVQGSAGKLNPGATLNRAQAAVMVLRVAEEAETITTPPPAPTGLAVIPTSPGNDPTPQVSGHALANRPVAVYDTFNGVTTKLAELSTNGAGIFYADLTTALVDGTHSFTAKVKNTLGIVSPASAAVTYVLDTVLPTGSITAPVVPAGEDDAAVNDSTPAFTVTATDERSGVKNVEFQVADYVEAPANPVWHTVSIDTTPTANTYSAEWPATGDLATLEEGEYLFRALITDNAGNRRTLDAIDVFVDSEEPTVEITAPVSDDDFYTEDATPTFTADADDGDEGSGIAKVEFFFAALDEEDPPNAWSDFTLISADVSPAYGASWGARDLDDGEYLLAVRATDLAGNQSPLMDGDEYVEGVTQDVVVDDDPPVVTITEPDEDELVPDEMDFTITWTLVDVTAPETVALYYTLDGSVGSPVWVLIEDEAPNDGSFVWEVPHVEDQIDTFAIRLVAIDEAGPELGDIPGHTTNAISELFTVYDDPEPVVILEAEDDDDAFEGVDGRDFHVEWTPTESLQVTSQRIYILPEGVALDIEAPGVQTQVATINNRTTATWAGPASLVLDSQNPRVTLAAGSYVIWIVVFDPAGRWTEVGSDAFTVVAEPEI